MKKLIRFKAPPWWWFTLGLVSLLCAWLILKLPNVQDMAIIVLVVVTSIYVKITQGMLNEMRQQRLDASRPLLVPVGGRAGVVCDKKMIFVKNQPLHVHNIGLGPAENIAIRLERRSVNSSPTVQLDEMLTAVEPLMSGDKERVRQWKTDEKPIEISDDYWIVISYDDLFHRHFETEARWIKERDSWVSIKTVPVKQLPPRVRDVNFYKGLSGNDEATP